MQWQQIQADKSLHNLPYKIELNKQGKIEMLPTSLIHSHLQGEIAFTLRNQLEGRVYTSLAIETSQGIKVPDVAWSDETYFQKHCTEPYVTVAPRLCVEIISPHNTKQETNQRIELFLEAGATEVWLVDGNGNIQVISKER